MSVSPEEFDATEVSITFTVKEWATISALMLSTQQPEAFPLFMGISAQVLEGTEHLA